MKETRLLKLAEVASRLSVSRPTIYRLILRGELATVHIGRALRFQESSVDRLVEGVRNEGTREAPHAKAL